MATLEKYIVSGFNSLKLYCKITSTPVYNKTEKNHTISIGGSAPSNSLEPNAFSGSRNFCFNGIIKAVKPDECYIDRVEYNAACVVDGSLKEKGNTIELVKIALWTIKNKFPQIMAFTLFDDSYIECIEGSKTDKLSLSCDYILKYNQSWYQRNFAAELPEPMATNLTESLKLLDEPLEPFDNVIQHREALRPFRIKYENSTTPRTFLNSLRGPEYCFTVGKWLEQYMSYIGVKIYKEGWFIRRENVIEPPNYNIQPTNNNIRGGFKQTKKFQKRKYSLIKHNSAGGYNN